jgi:hypothetical protein
MYEVRCVRYEVWGEIFCFFSGLCVERVNR